MHETTSSSLLGHFRPQLKYLTGLRFFAALFIFILHASDHGLIAKEFVQNFDLSKAVSFFFVLSGFVLSYAYHSRVVSPSQFYLSRFSRIWPITFSSLLFTLVFLPNYLYLPFSSNLNSSGVIFLSNILCVQSLIPIPSFTSDTMLLRGVFHVNYFFICCFLFLYD